MIKVLITAHRCTEDNGKKCGDASETQRPGVFHCFDVCLFDLVGCSTKLDGTQLRPYLCQCYTIVRICQFHNSEFHQKVSHVFSGLITNLFHFRQCLWIYVPGTYDMIDTPHHHTTLIFIGSIWAYLVLLQHSTALLLLRLGKCKLDTFNAHSLMDRLICSQLCHDHNS